MGHLKTFFAQGVENLISQISKSSNSRGQPGGGMLMFRIDRYIRAIYTGQNKSRLALIKADFQSSHEAPRSSLRVMHEHFHPITMLNS